MPLRMGRDGGRREGGDGRRNRGNLYSDHFIYRRGNKMTRTRLDESSSSLVRAGCPLSMHNLSQTSNVCSLKALLLAVAGLEQANHVGFPPNKLPS